MNKRVTAVIPVNTGTPDSYAVKDVRKYLRHFLGDKRVINLPWLSRKILVNFIIAPFRGPKSAKLYQEIWTDHGSPLMVNSLNFGNALQSALGEEYKVYTAMRYGNPSIEEALVKIKSENISEIILLPLYPQYADSTTGTIIAEFKRLIRKLKIEGKTAIIKPFFQDKAFIETFGENILHHQTGVGYDHVIFSFHGLPVKQTEKMHPGMTCAEADCRNTYNETNKLCYYASCHETAKLLAKHVNLPEDHYTVSFQSRLGMNWLKPYTDMVLKEKALRGAKKVLISSPAFVADCLETIHELGIEYKHQFIENGGEVLTVVESLNDNSNWINGMADHIKKYSLKAY